MDKINVLDKGYVRLVDHMGSDLSIVNAARVSYDKESLEFSERDQRLLTYLIEHNHESPLRHAALTFEIYAPLMIARQWWKYAVGSTHIDDQNGWNESSRRYITENEEFYYPEEWLTAPENSKQGSSDPLPAEQQEHWTGILQYMNDTALLMYNKALCAGIAPEQARLFLPSYGMYVRWRWTVSLAACIHYLQQRLNNDAQKEIQQYAQAIHKLVQPHYPYTFKNLLGTP
jgi:thymidylate synthase (FAD)